MCKCGRKPTILSCPLGERLLLIARGQLVDIPQDRERLWAWRERGVVGHSAPWEPFGDGKAEEHEEESSEAGGGKNMDVDEGSHREVPCQREADATAGKMFVQAL